MWKTAAGQQVSMVPQSIEDDDWETDPDFVNDVTEQEQRWGSVTVSGSGRTAGSINMDDLRRETEEADSLRKKKQLAEDPSNSTFGYGGKFGVEHDRVDKSAMTWEYKEKVEKHASQKDYVSGFGGKYGVQTDRQDKSAFGWDHIEKVEKHESQKDYTKGFGGKFGVQADRVDKSAVGWDHHEAPQKHESQIDHKIGFGGKFGLQTDRVDKSAITDTNDFPQKVGTNYTKTTPDVGQVKPSDLRAKFESLSAQRNPAPIVEKPVPKRGILAKAAIFSQPQQSVVESKSSNTGNNATGAANILVADKTSFLTQSSTTLNSNSEPKQLDQNKLTQFSTTAPTIADSLNYNHAITNLHPINTVEESKNCVDVADEDDKTTISQEESVTNETEVDNSAIVGNEQIYENLQQDVEINYGEESTAVVTVVENNDNDSNSKSNQEELLSYSEEIIDTGIKAIAMYDYSAGADDEISFDPNEIITHIEKIDKGWWRGLRKGRYGLFPANYVQLID